MKVVPYYKKPGFKKNNYSFRTECDFDPFSVNGAPSYILKPSSFTSTIQYNDTIILSLISFFSLHLITLFFRTT